MSTLKNTLPMALLASSVLMAQPATAQEIPESSPVFSFNRICYSQVPNLEPIRRMAGQLAWVSESKEQQAQIFDPLPKGLESWIASDGENKFRVAINQQPLSAEMKVEFPRLALFNTVTSCQIILGAGSPSEQIAADMQTMARKAPVYRGKQNGTMKTTEWSGGTADVEATVFFNEYTGTKKRGDIMQVIVITK